MSSPCWRVFSVPRRGEALGRRNAPPTEEEWKAAIEQARRIGGSCTTFGGSHIVYLRPTGPGELKRLPRFPFRFTLSLLRSAIRDDDLRDLAGHEGLTELCLHDTAITDRGLRHLAALPNLRRLDLSTVVGTTDKGMHEVCKCRALRWLDLRYTAISVDGVRRLAGMGLERMSSLRGRRRTWG